MKLVISTHQLNMNPEETHLEPEDMYVTKINPNDPDDLVCGSSTELKHALVFELPKDLNLIKQIVANPIMANDFEFLTDKDAFDGAAVFSLGYQLQLVDNNKKLIKKIKVS